MKCIHCGNDAKLKDRSGGKCPTCGRSFAFEPTGTDVFTDRGFQKALEKVSAGGRVKFTLGQLQHQADLVRLQPSMVGSFIAVLLLTITLVIGGFFFPLLWVLIPVAPLLWWLRRRRAVPVIGLTRGQTEAALERWQRAHGRVDGLVRPPDARPHKQVSDELLEYSFERAVITDTPETAEVLLANDFHFENSCAVLSVTGYPVHAFKAVLQMLRRNPDLQVFVLHDCTEGGCELAYNLANSDKWFKGIGTVRDVGLRPAQVDAMKLRRAAVDSPCPPHPSITEAERAWLSQWKAELAALPPDQLIKRLYREMTRPVGLAREDGSDSGGVGLFILPGTSSDGGGDAFG
jgi:hypothetical protein